MNILQNWKNIIEKANRLDRKSLEAIRFAVMFAVIIDLFGIYYYLKLKSLGGALLVVLIIGLVIVLLLERNLPPSPKLTPNKQIKKEVKTMKKETKTDEYLDLTPKAEQEEEEEEKPEEPKESTALGGFDTGLPNADEYNKRAEKALGFDL